MSSRISELRQVAIEALSRGRYQPRRAFAEDKLNELAQSIREQGIIEPIVIRPIGEDRYEILAGERRWRAAQLAGLDHVPCVLRHCGDEEAAEIAIIENIQREDLNPVEEAMAYKQLMDEFNYIHDEVAAAVGKSRTKITNALRLLKLDARVQQLLIDKEISEGHGKMIAGLPSHEQYEFARKSVTEAWSVRKLERVLKQRQSQPAIQNTQDANISRLERLASESVGSEVKLDSEGSNRSGWLKIKYHDYEVLAGILEKIGVDYDV